MIYIWKGRGWLLIIMALMSFGISLPCSQGFLTMVNQENETAIQISVFLIYTGVFIRTFFLLFPAKSSQHLIDAKTGENIFVKQVDSLYGLDVKIWAFGLLWTGLVVFSFSFLSALF